MMTDEERQFLDLYRLLDDRDREILQQIVAAFGKAVIEELYERGARGVMRRWFWLLVAAWYLPRAGSGSV
jgi:hypothetical protein